MRTIRARSVEKKKRNELLDVLVDVAPFLDGGDDGREVVIHEHDVGHFTRDIAAALTHRDADIGALQGRGIVDPVSRDRDDLPQVLQALDQAQLVLGGHAGKDVDRASRLAQLVG